MENLKRPNILKPKFFGNPEFSSTESTIKIESEIFNDFFFFRKEWILFPPEAAESLKPVRVPYEESTIYSSINLFSPSEDEVKLLKNIPGAKIVILEPGDVLLVPKSWWHYVESLNLSVSVNVWLPLETDSKERLKEALVKLIVNGIGKNIPSASENSKCPVSDCINFVSNYL